MSTNIHINPYFKRNMKKIDAIITEKSQSIYINPSFVKPVVKTEISFITRKICPQTVQSLLGNVATNQSLALSSNSDIIRKNKQDVIKTEDNRKAIDNLHLKKRPTDLISTTASSLLSRPNEGTDADTFSSSIKSKSSNNKYSWKRNCTDTKLFQYQKSLKKSSDNNSAIVKAEKTDCNRLYSQIHSYQDSCGKTKHDKTVIKKNQKDLTKSSSLKNQFDIRTRSKIIIKSNHQVHSHDNNFEVRTKTKLIRNVNTRDEKLMCSPKKNLGIKKINAEDPKKSEILSISGQSVSDIHRKYDPNKIEILSKNNIAVETKMVRNTITEKLEVDNPLIISESFQCTEQSIPEKICGAHSEIKKLKESHCKKTSSNSLQQNCDNNFLKKKAPKTHFDDGSCIKMNRKMISPDIKKGMLLQAHQRMIMKSCILKCKMKSQVVRNCYKIINNNEVSISPHKIKVNNKCTQDTNQCYRKNLNMKLLKSNYTIDKRRRRISTKISKPILYTPEIKYNIQRFKIRKQTGKLMMGKSTMKNNVVSKYKLSRSSSVSKERTRKLHSRSFVNISHRSKNSDKFVNIGGKMYKSTKMTLKKHDQLNLKSTNETYKGASKKCIGMKMSTLSEHSKFKLVRSLNFNKKNILLKPGSLIDIVRKKKLASFRKTNELCLFYNRYGKCKRKEIGICHFVHNPENIAICTRYLRGDCSAVNCPFSHKLDRSKMPMCIYFNEGCHVKDCHYRHVRVNPKAPVCLDFLKGHCHQGEDCKKKHILICEDFLSTGSCPRRAKCRLSHRKRPVFRKQSVHQKTKTKKVKYIGGVLGLQSSNVRKDDSKKVRSIHRYFDPTEPTQSCDADDLKEQTITEKKDDEFQLKRLRIMAKIEKMKNNYNIGNEIQESVSTLREINPPKNNSFIDARTRCSQSSCSWTSPLPSYIPLCLED